MFFHLLLLLAFDLLSLAFPGLLLFTLGLLLAQRAQNCFLVRVLLLELVEEILLQEELHQLVGDCLQVSALHTRIGALFNILWIISRELFLRNRRHCSKRFVNYWCFRSEIPTSLIGLINA